jgi:hypothetical protein
VFALDLLSEYEGEHMIFGLLGQANLTQNDELLLNSRNDTNLKCILQQKREIKHIRDLGDHMK